MALPDLTWRLLISPIGDGAMNMAIDQAIMEAVASGDSPPTLRFFAWEPPCLSLGYTQPLADVDLQRLAARGWHLVRRMTGGRAILHTDELTYSVAVPADHPLVAGDVVGSYRRLSQALVTGLQRLGIDPQADRRARAEGSTKGPVCFEVPSHYEITAGGKKLVGSAQVRKFGAVLQHGTLPLTGDITRILDALVFDSEEQRERVRERVRARATTLEEILGRAVSWHEAVTAMIAGFETTFGLTFDPATALTPAEQARADALYAEQYAAEAWNGRF